MPKDDFTGLRPISIAALAAAVEMTGAHLAAEARLGELRHQRGEIGEEIRKLIESETLNVGIGARDRAINTAAARREDVERQVTEARRAVAPMRAERIARMRLALSDEARRAAVSGLAALAALSDSIAVYADIQRELERAGATPAPGMRLPPGFGEIELKMRRALKDRSR